jgi:hypothetical protein
MTALLATRKSRSLIEAATLGIPSQGGSDDSKVIEQRLKSMRALMSGAVAGLTTIRAAESSQGANVADQLSARLSAFKKMTATIAMHLDTLWRQDLFATLDRLLDPEDWDADAFELPTEASFSTFLRMIIYLHPTKRPGLGLAPNGRMVAAWRKGHDRIVIECMDKDEVRWVLSRYVDGERESGAGQVLLHRVPDVTAPYDPEPLFTDGDKILA